MYSEVIIYYPYLLTGHRLIHNPCRVFVYIIFYRRHKLFFFNILFFSYKSAKIRCIKFYSRIKVKRINRLYQDFVRLCKCKLREILYDHISLSYNSEILPVSYPIISFTSCKGSAAFSVQIHKYSCVVKPIREIYSVYLSYLFFIIVKALRHKFLFLHPCIKRLQCFLFVYFKRYYLCRHLRAFKLACQNYRVVAVVAGSSYSCLIRNYICSAAWAVVFNVITVTTYHLFISFRQEIKRLYLILCINRITIFATKLSKCCRIFYRTTTIFTFINYCCHTSSKSYHVVLFLLQIMPKR